MGHFTRLETWLRNLTYDIENEIIAPINSALQLLIELNDATLSVDLHPSYLESLMTLYMWSGVQTMEPCRKANMNLPMVLNVVTNKMLKL